MHAVEPQLQVRVAGTFFGFRNLAGGPGALSS